MSALIHIVKCRKKIFYLDRLWRRLKNKKKIFFDFIANETVSLTFEMPDAQHEEAYL